MHLYFHITKTSNLFHFISNLTDWHFSVRTSYKKYWIEKTGDLSEEDAQWLAKADNLFKKYTFGNNYWGATFLRRPEEDVWETAEKNFGEKDSQRFKEIANYFTPRFKKIWNEEKELLENWTNILNRTKDRYLKNELVNELNTLFDTKPDLSSGIKIVLLMSSPTTLGGGSANIGYGAVTTELSRMSPDKAIHIWLNFWHEISHVYWEKTNNYMTMLNSYLDTLEYKPSLGDISFKILMKEGVLEAFIPNGVLAEKYFDMPMKDESFEEKNMYGWRSFSRNKLKDLSYKYVEEKKKIDTYFLKEVNKLLLEYLN